MDNNQRDLILDEIYKFIIEKGVLTSKQDVLDSDNKVYTKKLPVEVTVDKVDIKLVSLTGYEKDLSDASKNDIRVCVNNYRRDYLNLFVVSVGTDTLSKILKYLKEHVE